MLVSTFPSYCNGLRALHEGAFARLSVLTTFMLLSSNFLANHDGQTMLPCAVVHLIFLVSLPLGVADSEVCHQEWQTFYFCLQDFRSTK